jgi:hypothetical protein
MLTRRWRIDHRPDRLFRNVTKQALLAIFEADAQLPVLLAEEHRFDDAGGNCKLFHDDPILCLPRSFPTEAQKSGEAMSSTEGYGIRSDFTVFSDTGLRVRLGPERKTPKNCLQGT